VLSTTGPLKKNFRRCHLHDKLMDYLKNPALWEPGFFGSCFLFVVGRSMLHKVMDNYPPAV
jgi:hypothetical protein